MKKFKQTFLNNKIHACSFAKKIVTTTCLLMLSRVIKIAYAYKNCARIKTRSSADADNRLDSFSGQSRSTNMVPFHM